jgi:polyvinyl alcohol dehydrogenase (cytochrome)
VKWKYTAAGDVPATPAVVGGYVYVGDEGGNMTKLDASTGAMVWQKSVASLLSNGNPLNAFTFAGAWSRTTPVVTSDSVIFGTMLPGASEVMLGAKAAYVVSLSPADGSVNWVSQVLDSNPATDIQQSPVYDGKNIYIGTTSSEEAGSTYTFRGSVVAMDASKAGKGKVLWQTYTIDSSLSGYAGGAVWGSTPVVDKKRNQLYVGTGNNYVTNGTPMVKGNNIDSILALDLGTGEIKWAANFAPGGSDVWTFSNHASMDGDFGSGPNFFTANVNGTMTEMVGAGQKSGWYYALNPDTGAVIWKTQFGPGGSVGGIHWGTATDGVRVYAGVNNTPGKSWTLAGGMTTTNGAWGAMDAATGKILWQTANPNSGMSSTVGGGGTVSVNGPVKVTNGVVFGGSMDSAGTMYAFDAMTGKILWSYKSGGSVYGGPAIAGKTVFWGSGYSSSLGFGTSSRTLYAFSVP